MEQSTRQSEGLKSSTAIQPMRPSICLEAGANLVLVEAAELVERGQVDRAFLLAISQGISSEHVMLELPGPWIPDVRTCDIEALKKLLVLEFGPDVNVANVAPDTVLDFEATRTGLGVAGPLSSQLQKPA
jgi:phosphosulfolactate synthase